MIPTRKCQKLHFFRWPLKVGSKSKSVSIDLHFKNANSTAQINMFTAKYKKMVLISIAKFSTLTTSRGRSIYLTHLFKRYQGLKLSHGVICPPQLHWHSTPLPIFELAVSYAQTWALKPLFRNPLADVTACLSIFTVSGVNLLPSHSLVGLISSFTLFSISPVDCLFPASARMMNPNDSANRLTFPQVGISGSEWNILRTIGWITMTFATNIHYAHRMNRKDFWSLDFSSSSASRSKLYIYPMKYIMSSIWGVTNLATPCPFHHGADICGFEWNV